MIYIKAYNHDLWLILSGSVTMLNLQLHQSDIHINIRIGKFSFRKRSL